MLPTENFWRYEKNLRISVVVPLGAAAEPSEPNQREGERGYRASRQEQVSLKRSERQTVETRAAGANMDERSEP